MTAIAISVILGQNTPQIRQKRDFPFYSSDRSKRHFFLKARHRSNRNHCIGHKRKNSRKILLGLTSNFWYSKDIG